MRDYTAVPWAAQRDDSRGDRFEFRYRGGSLVKIHRVSGTEDGPWVDPQATNAIDVLARDMIGKATPEWLSDRADEWIEDRNNDLATGDYDRMGL